MIEYILLIETKIRACSEIKMKRTTLENIWNWLYACSLKPAKWKTVGERRWRRFWMMKKNTFNFLIYTAKVANALRLLYVRLQRIHRTVLYRIEILLYFRVLVKSRKHDQVAFKLSIISCNFFFFSLVFISHRSFLVIHIQTNYF